MKVTLVTVRTGLDRAHGHSEKITSVITAFGLIVGGLATAIGGMRTIMDIVSPPSAPDLNKIASEAKGSDTD